MQCARTESSQNTTSGSPSAKRHSVAEVMSRRRVSVSPCSAAVTTLTLWSTAAATWRTAGSAWQSPVTASSSVVSRRVGSRAKAARVVSDASEFASSRSAMMSVCLDGGWPSGSGSKPRRAKAHSASPSASSRAHSGRRARMRQQSRTGNRCMPLSP
eukprot:Amastigsp_a181480_39.p2 type:complete len:157 gc:universal Amastigsp_a181480_39:164-634(+)